MPMKIILASASAGRRQILADAGLDVESIAPELDERALEAPLEEGDVTPEDRAQILAEAKAIAVSEAHPEAIVIGADQILSLGDEVLHKPADMEEARRRLLTLSGRTHQLSSAVVLARNGMAFWHHVGVAHLTMRKLDPGFVGRHLSAVGDAALSSVGAYQVEGPGIQLFEKIEGDHFTIIGLPFLPLLSKLRELDAIDG